MVNKSVIVQLQQDGAGEFSALEFIHGYEKAYVEYGSRSGFKTKKSFAPSQLGYSHGTCPRYWVIAFNGAEFVDEVDSRSLGNMENGTLAHQRIIENIKRMEILTANEVEITLKDPPVRGFIDALINWKGKRIPAEIKTANSRSFTFRETTGKPSPSHLLQVLIYLVATDSDEGFLLYENKDTQELCIIPVVMTDKNKEYVEYLFNWMRQTYKAYEDDLLPERPWNRVNAKICKTCPVRKVCYEELGDGEVKMLPLEVIQP